MEHGIYSNLPAEAPISDFHNFTSLVFIRYPPELYTLFTITSRISKYQQCKNPIEN